MLTLYSGTDGTITLTGLMWEPTGTVVTGATITGTLVSATGQAVWSSMVFTSTGGGSYTYSFTGASVPPLGTYSLYLYLAGVPFAEQDVVVQEMTV